jgi:hypothetical protein
VVPGVDCVEESGDNLARLLELCVLDFLVGGYHLIELILLDNFVRCHLNRLLADRNDFLTFFRLSHAKVLVEVTLEYGLE